MTAISKQALFSTFYTQQRKDDVIVTSLSIYPDFLYRKIFILSQSNSVQNLSSLTLKTKSYGGGRWKTPSPGPTPAKKACTNRVKFLLDRLLRTQRSQDKVKKKPSVSQNEEFDGFV